MFGRLFRRTSFFKILIIVDLDLITIAKRGSLGKLLTQSFKSTSDKLSSIKNLSLKIENSKDFSFDEKEHNRAFTIISAVSIFENYLNDILFNLLIAFPKKFGKKQFEIEELKEEGSLLGLFEKKANQTILDLAYGKFDNYIEKFSKIAELTDKITVGKIEVVNEIKSTRDVYVHNDGKANYIYLQKAGEKARSTSENKTLTIDIDYVTGSLENITDLLQEIFDKIPANYKNSSYRRVFKTMWENTCLNKRVKFDAAWEVLNEESFVIRDLDTEYGFSHSEVEVYKMFKDIYLGTNTTDFGYLFRRWNPKSKEHQIALSWLNYPFWL